MHTKGTQLSILTWFTFLNITYRFLPPTVLFLRLHCCGWSDTNRSRLVRIHRLPLCCAKQTIELRYSNAETPRQKEEKTEEKRLWPCLTLSLRCSLYAERAGSVYLARLVECLCKWTLGWSSSNHGGIIKTCWSLQSWERGRFINDTLTAAVDRVCGWEMVILLEIIGYHCHLPAGPYQCEWSFM